MLLAGPILRRVDANSVNIWVAFGDENPPINAILKDDSTDVAGTSNELTKVDPIVQTNICLV
jgi:hypothetical protein